MADTDSAPEGETPTQKQARLRREKRQKKMAEQGEDRLAKIKALNGGVAPPEEVLGGPAAPKSATVEDHDDPDEVDIDTVHHGGRAGQQQDPLAAAMFRQMQQGGGQNGQGGRGGIGGMGGGEEEDPMVKMMQQLTGMMGGNPQDPNDPNQQPQIPLALQSLLGGAMKTKDQQAAAPATGSAYLWRIVHAVFAFSLASCITLTSTFNGSKLSRSQSVYSTEGSRDGYGFGPRLFVMFTTAELLLQGTRYFVEKGQLQGNGLLATVANSGFVPEPYAQYVRTVGRYVGIAQTIMSDAMVIVFVFGALAWWRGMAAS